MMSISIAHMYVEIVKPQPNMTKQSEERVNELVSIRKIILRKRQQDHSLINFFFAFQFVLVGTFIAASCYVYIG